MQPGNQLLFPAKTLTGASGETRLVTPETSGFEYLTFRARRLVKGESFAAETGNNELGLVILGGRCSVISPARSWMNLGGRAHVFSGLPHALYLPIETSFTVQAETDCDLAFCFCKADQKYQARLSTPGDVEVEVRGGANATRQINHILKPDFPAQRLLIVEVYTPSGHWSSYPPHKHNVRNRPAEVDLEEIYYYKVNHPDGYAIQKVYTSDRKIDATLTVRDGELVLIPEGYHPRVAAQR